MYAAQLSGAQPPAATEELTTVPRFDWRPNSNGVRGKPLTVKHSFVRPKLARSLGAASAARSCDLTAPQFHIWHAQRNKPLADIALIAPCGTW